MFFSATSILALVGLLVTPVFSAPIHVHGGSSSITSHPENTGLEKRSPLLWGQGHHHDSTTIVERDILEYSDLIARDDSSILEGRSTDRSTRSSLAKRAEGETMRLARRINFFTKIKEGFQKAIKKIRANSGSGSNREQGIRVSKMIKRPFRGAGGPALDAVFKRDVDGGHLFERDPPELETRSFEDGEGLEARSLEGEKMETRSLDNAYELETRSFDDVQ